MTQELVEYYDMTRDPIKEYFLDKIQSVVFRKKLMIIKMEHHPKFGAPLSSGPLKTPKYADPERNLNHLQKSTKDRAVPPRDTAAVKSIIKPDHFALPGKTIPVSPGPAKVISFGANANALRKGSLDVHQRKAIRSKEYNFLDQLGEAVNTNEAKERADSITKEFHEQKEKNDSIISSHLQLQNQRIAEKLKERQLNSFNRSLQKDQSMSKFTGPRKDPPEPDHKEGPADIANILSGLKNG